jgi:hypothetical protein
MTMGRRGPRRVSIQQVLVLGGTFVFIGGMFLVVLSKGFSLGASALILTIPVLLLVGILIFAIFRFSSRGMADTYRTLLVLRNPPVGDIAFIAYVQADARRALDKLSPGHGRIMRYSVFTADAAGLKVWAQVGAEAPMERVAIPANIIHRLSVEADPYAGPGAMALYVETHSPSTRFSLTVLEESTSPRAVRAPAPLESMRDQLGQALSV